MIYEQYLQCGFLNSNYSIVYIYLQMINLISRSNPEEIIVPPVNFSMVAQGVYRGAYPNYSNFSFLKNLGLKTLLFLCEEDYPPTNLEFLKENGITLITVQMEGNKAPFKTIPNEQMVEALRHLTDVRNHPIFVHCNKGTHRTGTVVGCLRKLQNWSLTSIFDEYRCFAGTKARQIDERYIELFELPKDEFDTENFPSWLKNLE
ncbi:putative tyrosine-protein phosphatase [Tritrichomonas foetus]|uniref:diphosphoinositol-polyphosphate diphosphatase n=1 Tax=Tritrichomonas foetus TaxID=1144522 RepID=A0A1J4KMI5_9EUKA|nr:putative tyrosine-protein phosphatase [Tritrichomonas foetus]|eukprot:OHT12354.1 putative tyrosine-protein phosphatase [Tritrichomonas foetus]